MDTVSFLPWVGRKYNQSEFGVKVLVLGESHYSHEECLEREFTQRVIKEHGIEGRHSTFTKIVKVLLNRGAGYIGSVEKGEVWEHVAFYNFVQDIVGETSATRPTDKMWERGKQLLPEVLAHFKPDVMLVLGYSTADHLPDLPESVQVAVIKHPCRSISYQDTNPEFQRALCAARELKTVAAGSI